MEKQRLYEFRCEEDDCGYHFLAMKGTDDGIYCPYCGEYADYAPGLILPVVEFTPGTRKLELDF